MSIYIATNEHGRGVSHVTEFHDRHEFLDYAWEVLAFNNSNALLRGRPTIDDICEALYDAGIGHGARSHFRISRRSAEKMGMIR